LFFWPSIDSRYLAPECYDKGRYLQLSDVFSFGLIVYEILTGHPAIARHLTRFEIMRSIAVKAERPLIPDFVVPFTRELITDCLSQEPGKRPSFEEIVDRLVEANFKLTANVNSVKLSKFVKNIESWESQNAVAPH
jgi:serine/threonine protein kinase